MVVYMSHVTNSSGEKSKLHPSNSIHFVSGGITKRKNYSPRRSVTVNTSTCTNHKRNGGGSRWRRYLERKERVGKGQ